MRYELWELSAGNLVGAFETEAEALAAVADAIRRYAHISHMGDLMVRSRAEAIPRSLNRHDSTGLTALRRRSEGAGTPDSPLFPRSGGIDEAVTGHRRARRVIKMRMCEIRG